MWLASPYVLNATLCAVLTTVHAAIRGIGDFPAPRLKESGNASAKSQERNGPSAGNGTSLLSQVTMRASSTDSGSILLRMEVMAARSLDRSSCFRSRVQILVRHTTAASSYLLKRNLRPSDL